MKEIIYIKEAPEPVDPYSQAIKAGNLVFCSGQIPIDTKTGSISGGDISEQTEIVLKNLISVLSATGCGIEDIIKTTVYTGYERF